FGNFSEPPRKPKIFPAASIRTSSPACFIKPVTYSRAAQSVSENPRRVTPPSAFRPNSDSFSTVPCRRCGFMWNFEALPFSRYSRTEQTSRRKSEHRLRMGKFVAVPRGSVNKPFSRPQKNASTFLFVLQGWFRARRYGGVDREHGNSSKRARIRT